MRTTRRLHRIPAATGLILGVALIAGLAVLPARAQAGIVHDPIQTARHLAEFREQLARWRATAEHYRQQMIRTRGMRFSDTAMNDIFQEVPLTYGMEETCRRQDGDLVGAITGLFRPDADAEILEQQDVICRRRVQAQNMQYNETVRFLKRQRDRSNEARAIDDIRDGVTEKGSFDEVGQNLLRHDKSMQMDHQWWQATLAAYDKYIASLDAFELRLANRALGGKQPDAFSAIVQGTVLRQTLRSMRDD